MLNRLEISNVALIKKLELEFCGALNILSGETGAGKSIIVDSLMLLLGEKYDKNILRYGEEKGYVEGVFDCTEQAIEVLNEMGIENEGIIIVNRKFNADSKNEIRINGKTATASMLKNLMSTLVDIYGQHEYQSLTKPNEQMKILNYFVRSKTAGILHKVSEEYQKYIKVNKELKELGSVSEREKNIDLIKYQLNEINKANIKEGEEDALTEKRKIISSAEKIAASLNSAKNSLSDSEDGTAVEFIAASLKTIDSISHISQKYSLLCERLDSVLIELKDIAETVADELENVDFNENELEKIDNRLDIIKSIKRKYGSFKEISEFKEKSEELLYRLENCSQIYENLIFQKESLIKSLYDLSRELSSIRKNGAKELSRLVEKELSDLGMNGAKLEVIFEAFPDIFECEKHISQNGMDKFEFYFSANAGQPLKPLAKIISGGEMSRFILALKVISSRLDEIPTMIFDEIDTGISGKIGQEVAKKLAIISKNHQVLCVTHLPQIASMADNHYYISKSVQNDETITSVDLLKYSGVITEISRLSGAKDISAQSENNAKEMKSWSNEFKASLK